jgi:hypothetical protein
MDGLACYPATRAAGERIDLQTLKSRTLEDFAKLREIEPLKSVASAHAMTCRDIVIEPR